MVIADIRSVRLTLGATLEAARHDRAEIPCGLGPSIVNWRSATHTRLPRSASAAIPRNAPVSPVGVCLKKPTTVGPTNPPQDPTALMRAMPEAAAGPLRNFVGRHQNGAPMIGPESAITTSAITSSREC